MTNQMTTESVIVVSQSNRFSEHRLRRKESKPETLGINIP
jgi:hypothetical protein